MEANARAYSLSQLPEMLSLEKSWIFRKLKEGKYPSVTGKSSTGHKTAFYLFTSLPAAWQAKIEAVETAAAIERQRAEDLKKLADMGITGPCPFNPEEAELNMLAYSKARPLNRALCDKYMAIEDQAGHMRGNELKQWLENVWNKENPDHKVKYRIVIENRKRERNEGKKGLIGRFGSKKGFNKTEDEHQAYFDSLWLKEGAPPANACWRIVVGKFCQAGDITDYPVAKTFVNRCKRERGESAIYRQQHGYAKWDRKYGYYIDRDYSALLANDCWVSDHAQVDVLIHDPETGKLCAAWITSFICMKTDKVLSSFYHCAAPNSDHIFQAFQIAVERYGLPGVVYVDQGKDYRCADFGGGRKSVSLHKVTLDEKKAKSMLGLLGVRIIFAIPYNAKAKTVERYHLRIKTDFSVMMTGYRGGNVTERPEQLAKDTKAGKLLEFAEVRTAYYQWVEEVYNKTTSYGKKLLGQSPDDAWNTANPVKRTVTEAALSLFCMRTSKEFTIGRNGIFDSKNKLTYWAEFMVGQNGTRAIMRRNPENLNRAWVMTPDNLTLLGIATIAGLVPAIATDEIGQQAVSDAIARQRHITKAVKEMGAVARVPDIAEIINCKAAAAKVLNPDAVETRQPITQIMPKVAMQNIVRQHDNRMEEAQAASDGVSSLASGELEVLQRKLDKVVNLFCPTQVDKDEAIEEAEELKVKIAGLKRGM